MREVRRPQKDMRERRSNAQRLHRPQDIPQDRRKHRKPFYQSWIYKASFP